MKIRYPANIRLSLVYILLLGFLPAIGWSQDAGSCAEKLKNAQLLFERGQIEQVTFTLQGCMKSGFNREESLIAYKLLIQAYLFDDNLELADSAMLAFLKKYPEYQVSPTDHSSFVHLYNSFNVKPVLQISFHLGTNLPFLTFVDKLSSASEPGKSYYSTEALNLFTSLEFKFELSRKLELNFEAGYSHLAFTNKEHFMEFGDINYTEVQNRLEIPVSLTYNLKNFGKWTLYGRFGLGSALNLGSSAKASFNPTDLNNTNIHTGSDIVRKDSRIDMDLFTQLGAGIKYKTPGGFIIAELRSNFGMLNQTIRGGNSASELLYYYYYIDDDFRFNSLNISVGYTQLFYKPSKRKE